LSTTGRVQTDGVTSIFPDPEKSIFKERLCDPDALPRNKSGKFSALATMR